ncbi:hypothetical protein ACI0FM_02090 [Paenochrobactrum sp. BZR 588]|uniref:hypothetical protein n=1 Tax=unclassified Paenochrobactrum TaxID=2639760 RepID=UPI0038537CD4
MNRIIANFSELKCIAGNLKCYEANSHRIAGKATCCPGNLKECKNKEILFPSGVPIGFDKRRLIEGYKTMQCTGVGSHDFTEVVGWIKSFWQSLLIRLDVCHSSGNGSTKPLVFERNFWISKVMKIITI